MEKSSFVLFTEYEKHFEFLSDKELGELIRAIFRYQRTGEITKLSSKCLMAFSFIQADMERNMDKWEKTRQSRAEAGAKGAKARWDKCNNDISDGNSNMANYSKNSKAISEIAKIAVNVNVNDNDNVNDNVKDKEYKKESVREKSISAQQNFFDTHPNIQVESLPGNITEIDFTLLSEKIENSKILKGRTSFNWLCREWAKIKEGYYDDFKNEKPPQQTRRAMRDL